MSSTTTSSSRPSSSSGTQACAACKYQRRKCTPDCILAPYFPPENNRQFLNAHRLFGVSNILKIIRNLEPHQRSEAMKSIIFQADARARDPVGGCYAVLRDLYRQIERDSAELDLVMRSLAFFRRANAHGQPPPLQMPWPCHSIPPDHQDSSEAFFALPPPLPPPLSQISHHEDQHHLLHPRNFPTANYSFSYPSSSLLQSNSSFQSDTHHQQFLDNNDENMPTKYSNDEGYDQGGRSNFIEGSCSAYMPRENNFDTKYDEDVKPHFSGMLDDDGKSPLHSNPNNSYQCSSNNRTAVKEDSIDTEEVQEHDLKGAASLFTLKNCNNSGL